MRTHWLLLFLASISLGGCYVSRYPRDYGDVSFAWTFSGLECSSVPQVASVQINIPGEALQNDGVYPCSANGYSGITLSDFAPGSYDFTIQGLSYSQAVLYSASGSFTVNGSVQVNVDLLPVGSATSFAYITWTFPPNSSSQNPTCDQAGASYVDVSIDQGTAQRYSCAAGMTPPGVQTPLIAPGQHQIQLLGIDSTGFPYYRVVGTLTTNASGPVSASYPLEWNVGGVSVSWQLLSGSTPLTCAQAGVQTVVVNFKDANGNLAYGPNGDAQPCADSPILYNSLLPGTYQVFLLGTGSASTYRSNNQNPPTVNIVAGRFVDTSSTPTVVPMYSQ